MPNARSWASTASTDRPRVTASRATPAPVMPRPMTTTSTSVGAPASPGVIGCVGHRRERPRDQGGELGVELLLGGLLVDHRVHGEHEAVGGEQQRPGDGHRVALPDLAGLLALGDRVGGEGQDQLLRAAAPGEQVGEDQLGVELDDPDEQLVLAQLPDGADDRVGDALDGRPAVGDLLGHDAGPLAGHQVAEQRRHVGPGAVDRHPRDAGAAGDLGQRRTPPAHVEDAVAGGVEVGVPGLRLDALLGLGGVTK